jgi:hypothetical protein
MDVPLRNINHVLQTLYHLIIVIEQQWDWESVDRSHSLSHLGPQQIP